MFARPNVWAVVFALALALTIFAASTLFFPPSSRGIFGWDREPTLTIYLTRWAFAGLGVGVALGLGLYFLLISATPGRRLRWRVDDLVHENRRAQSTP